MYSGHLDPAVEVGAATTTDYGRANPVPPPQGLVSTLTRWLWQGLRSHQW